MTEILSEVQQMNAVHEIGRQAGFAFENISWALTKPHVIYKVTPVPEGTSWMCLLGDNLQEGIAGFGDTPAEAAAAFDKAWETANTPAAMLAGKAAKEGAM